MTKQDDRNGAASGGVFHKPSIFGSKKNRAERDSQTSKLSNVSQPPPKPMNTKGLGDHRKAMAILGGDDHTGPPKNMPSQMKNSNGPAPWENPALTKTDSVAPWDTDPASGPPGTSTNDSVAPWDSGPSSGPPGPPEASKNASVAPWDEKFSAQFQGGPQHNNSIGTDADFMRRPSVASANTVSSQSSKTSTGGRFQKSLKGFFGDDFQQAESKKTSDTSTPSSARNGKDANNAPRNNFPFDEASQPQASNASSNVAPWDYQDYNDVKSYGDAPVRQPPPNVPQESNAPLKAPEKPRTGLLHRATKSKDDAPRQQAPPTSNPQRPMTSRESSTTHIAPFGNGTPPTSTPMSSTSNFTPTSPNSGPVRTNTDMSMSSGGTKKEKKGGLFSRVKSKIKDTGPEPTRAVQQESQPVEPTHSITRPTASDRDPTKQDRQSSLASYDSGTTIKPIETVPEQKLERQSTASSKMFGRHRKVTRGQSYASDDMARPRQPSTVPEQSNLFSLDTNLDDMSDIISASAKPTSPGDISAKDGKTPGIEKGMQDWSVPDSWAVKGTEEEALADMPEVDESGLQNIEEEDDTVYFMRVFRTDSTFATLSTGVNATVADILQMLAKKSVLHDTLDHYQLLIKKHDLTRQLRSNERPIAIQKKMLQMAGYEVRDHIDNIGRDDNSYLCRFTFTHEKQTGFGSGLDKEVTKMQKFSNVDLSGKSLLTIPIALHTRASEIASLNLSKNLALNVPRDFIQSCMNLREIKYTGNEAWKLPTSLSYANRLTVLDVSNNRLESLKNAELDRLHSLVSIKLSNNKLHDVPPYFANFRQLRSLTMSSNNFTVFPELITGLRSLVDLDISFNKLSSLPKIGQVTTLERLWVTNNNLSGPFNESFKSLVNLKEIDARFNGITNIDNVTSLPKLETLLVGHNAIAKFTGTFQKLRTLVLDHNPMTAFDLTSSVATLSTLNAASCKLVDFKEAMFDYMPNLQKLNLDKNHFINMSPQIGRLAKLEHFSMAKNPLNLIPPSIGNLVELKFLNLRECNLKTLPPEIWYCLKLETLNVCSNVLESFPKQSTAPPQKNPETPVTTPGLSSSPSFEELGKLEDFQQRRPSQASGLLSVGSSPIGSQRNGSIVSLYGQGAGGNRKTSVVSRTATEGSMTPTTRKDSTVSQTRFSNTFAGSLRHLSLADNRLEDDVYQELVILPELRLLNLSYNELTDFPQGLLRRWANLTELYLSGNELTSLPSEDFEESCGLKVLHLNSNRFQVLPAELCKVHKLAVLDIGSNLLKYNVSNWPYDWNWTYNTNLKYLNFSGNKRLEIKPASQHVQMGHGVNGVAKDLTSFQTLNYLRVLGLMDVTLLSTTPDESEDRRVRTSASYAGALVYGMADSLGRNDHLSILDILVPRFRSHEGEVVVGMFDGQSLTSGGSKVARYLQENFSATFADQLSQLEATDTGPLDALRRTFLTMNKDMANTAGQTIDAREQRGSIAGRQGSTASRGSVSQILSQEDLNSGGVATVLYLNNMDLYVANCGDAQALLVRTNSQHKFLTEKHDPADANERERIREAGGYVSRQGKLNDFLEVSRAFGYFQHMPSVIAAPHLEHCVLTESDELILLASKEFWDFVTPDLAVDVARAEKADLYLASEKLRDLAMAYGAQGKIMVMVLGISDLKKRNASRYRGSTLSMAQQAGFDDPQIFPSRTKKKKTDVGDSTLARLEEPKAPVGEVAIVFTDIKNSTALWEILPIAMRSSIQIHNGLFRRQLRLIGGYEVKTEGDAFMVSFPTVTSALLWCFSCQSHLLELPWPTEILDTVHCQERLDSDQNRIYRGLSVRMGIHFGKPVCEQDPITGRMDYFGPMVNRAARISSVADGGQISVSSDYIAELQRTLEAYADSGRSNSIGSEEAVDDDPQGAQIRNELQQLSTQGFEVKDLGEKKLKGLENPEFVYLMYPHALAGRLAIASGGDKPGATEPSTEAGALGKDSQLNIKPDAVWQLWDLALRLEMLCSLLEDTEKARELRKPELSLLTRMKESGGEISDNFMLNLLEHQVVRIETTTTSLQLRHMLQPLKGGDKLSEHARPMTDVLKEVSQAMTDMAQWKKEKEEHETMKEEYEALKQHMRALEESGIVD